MLTFARHHIVSAVWHEFTGGGGIRIAVILERAGKYMKWRRIDVRGRENKGWVAVIWEGGINYWGC